MSQVASTVGDSTRRQSSGPSLYLKENASKLSLELFSCPDCVIQKFLNPPAVMSHQKIPGFSKIVAEISRNIPESKLRDFLLDQRVWTAL